jgi:hypothetical protein
MHNIRLALIAGSVSTLLLLSACGGSTAVTSDYSYGPLSQTGMLVSTGVSLVRRGTHVLVAGGKTAFYLESKTQNLQEFSGKRVYVSGTLERNVHEKYLPVLVVDALQLAEREVQQKTWTLPALSLSFTAPETWQGIAAERSISFLDGDTGSGTVLTIDAIDAKGLPEGIPAVIGGSVAVKAKSAVPGTEEIHVLRSGQVIRIRFTPDAAFMAEQRAVYESLLSSVKFQTSSSNASSAAAQGTGSVLQPCGGSAGILCPAGQYCDVFDAQNNIGKCRKRS